jgi:hypothetical protein
MRLVALSAGIGTGFSLGGSGEVLATGLLMGIPAGVLYVAIRKYLPGPRLLRGALFGLAYFVVLVLVPPSAARSALAAVGQVAIVLTLFGPLFSIYGIILELISKRLLENGSR